MFVAAACGDGREVLPGGRLYPVTIEAGQAEISETGISESRQEPRLIGSGEGSRSIWDAGDAYYYWTPGDEVGMSVTETGASSTIAHNVRMTGNIPDKILNTTFTGNFTQAQIEAMSKDGKYDYYSYFPYQSGGGDAAYPKVRFSIPSRITLTPNQITATYAPMVAIPHLDTWPITYLDGGGQVYSETIRFKFRHVMSFLALGMECNLLSQPITSVTITATGTNLSGELDVDITDGTAVWATGANTLTIDIDGGMEVGDVIFVPMLPGDLTAQTLTIRFDTADGRTGYIGAYPVNSNMADVTVGGGGLERGKTHSLQVKVPFRVNFNETYTLADAGLSGSGPAGSPFTYKDYTFKRSVLTDIMTDYMSFRTSSYPNTAVLVAPSIDTRTASGRNNIPVQLRILMRVGSRGTKTIHYGAVPPTSNGVSDDEFESQSFPSLNYPNWDWFTFDNNITLTSATPCAALNFQANQETLSIQEIQLIPAY